MRCKIIMKKEFTPDYIAENKGCYRLNQVVELSFIKDKRPIISINDMIESEMPLKDKYWWVMKKCDLTIRQKQDLAILCAEIVLEIYENKYPDNKAPRLAIEAAKAYLDGKITIDELREKRRNAYTADADADAAAYAADAAVYTADAAADAYTADAAYAAYAAAYAAYAAAKKFTQALFDNLKNFVNNN